MTERQDTTVTLEETAVQDLTSRLRGTLLRPGDAGYEETRPVYNAMIDKSPALIARCVDVADVIAAVNFAREQKLTLAVRGGGHNGPGLGTCDDGLVIDLSDMKGIHVDPSARTARVEGGCTWGEVDHATHPYGLATPSGFISTTGVGRVWAMAGTPLIVPRSNEAKSSECFGDCMEIISSVFASRKLGSRRTENKAWIDQGRVGIDARQRVFCPMGR